MRSHLLVVTLALLPLAGCADAPVAPAGNGDVYQVLASGGATVDPVAARDMISIYRRNHGLSTLAIDPTLQGLAASQARAMASAGTLGHEVRGSLPARLAGAGLAGRVAVENVSAGYHTMAEAFSGWRQSPPHDRNMLDPAVTRMGIATAYAPGSHYKVYWALVLTN